MLPNSLANRLFPFVVDFMLTSPVKLRRPRPRRRGPRGIAALRALRLGGRVRVPARRAAGGAVGPAADGGEGAAAAAYHW
eukprot:gene34861-23863_t